MALRKLERRNYGGKWPVSIKYQNLHTFKEGLILLCQGILETRRITHLDDSAHFTITLNFSPLNRSPSDESIKPGQFVAKVFFIMLNEVLKSCKNDNY